MFHAGIAINPVESCDTPKTISMVPPDPTRHSISDTYMLHAAPAEPTRRRSQAARHARMIAERQPAVITFSTEEVQVTSIPSGGFGEH